MVTRILWEPRIAYLVSKHTVSSITHTSWIVLFHTTMLGRWSVVAMWGGRHRAGIVGGLPGVGIPLVLLDINLEMPSKIPPLIIPTHVDMLSALGQLLRT